MEDKTSRVKKQTEYGRHVLVFSGQADENKIDRRTRVMQTGVIRRSRLQVLTEILRICKSPQGKTRLMQKANLSFDTLQNCLQQLQKLEMVALNPDKLDYLITRKGIIFLEKWVQLQEFLAPEERISIKAKRFIA